MNNEKTKVSENKYYSEVIRNYFMNNVIPFNKNRNTETELSFQENIIPAEVFMFGSTTPTYG